MAYPLEQLSYKTPASQRTKKLCVSTIGETDIKIRNKARRSTCEVFVANDASKQCLKIHRKTSLQVTGPI